MSEDDIIFMDIEKAAKKIWPNAIVRDIKTPADLERLYQDGQAQSGSSEKTAE